MASDQTEDPPSFSRIRFGGARRGSLAVLPQRPVQVAVPDPDRPPATADPAAGPDAPNDIVRSRLFDGSRSPLRRYADMVGVDSWWELLKYEAATTLLGPIPGALGILLRRLCYRGLFGAVGRGVVIGRNVIVRYGRRIILEDGVVVDDGCLLDGRGGGEEAIVLARSVILNRGVSLHAKHGPIRIGARTDVGAGGTFNAASGIFVDEDVSMGGDCKLGGRSVRLGPMDETPDEPGRAGDRFSRGPIRVGRRTRLGGGVRILDGVSVGDHAMVGAGLVLRQDVPSAHVALPRDQVLCLPRSAFAGPVAEPGDAIGKPRMEVVPGAPTAPKLSAGGLELGRGREVELVLCAVRSVNEQLPPDRRVDLRPDAPLLEPGGPLDSLGAVNLIVALEELVSEELSATVDLAGGDAHGGGAAALETVSSLAEHLGRRLGAA